MWFCHESSGGLWLLSSWKREMWSTRGHIALWVAVKLLRRGERTCCAVQDSLADARGVHLEKRMVHKQVESFFLPGSPGVLISTEAAQQLDTCTITGGIVSTGKRKTEQQYLDPYNNFQLHNPRHWSSFSNFVSDNFVNSSSCVYSVGF